MKVYAIVIYSGEYEDRREWIDSIWDDAFKAEKARESIVEKYLEMREIETLMITMLICGRKPLKQEKLA